MADPLKVLREYASGQRTLREYAQGEEKYLVFSDLAYPRDVKTNLTVYNKPNEYYTLESLLFIWERREINHASYVKEAAGKNIRAVTRPDRREILDYLKGDRSEYPANFDKYAPVAPPIPASRFNFQDEGPERKRPKLDTSMAKGPRIEELLKEGGPSADAGIDDPSELRALNEKLTPDKIAALKKKMRNHQKRTATAAVDDLEMEVGGESGARIDMELKKKERVWKTRVNCLEAHTKQFTSILQLLQSLRTREETEARNKAMGVSGHAPPKGGPDPRAMTAGAQRKGAMGYSRYDQEQFTKDQMDLGIESEMTFVGGAFKNINEQKANDPANRQSQLSRQPQSIASASSVHSGGTEQKKRTSRTPIIIIPASTNGSSIISMYNVRDVLQDMKFVRSEERKAEGKRENEVLLQRKHDNVTVPYRVVDNPLKLTPQEWERVVAVFAMGPTWQFKNWKWNGNPVEIFANVAGFHLSWDSIKLDQNVAKWSVTPILLSQTKRHLDRARLQVFWNILDKHIAKYKPFLRY